MAWARHPRCGSRSILVLDRADEIAPEESLAFRAYQCPACTAAAGRPWYFWTAEAMFLDDAPTGKLRGKYADDFEASGQPVGRTTSTGTR